MIVHDAVPGMLSDALQKLTVFFLAVAFAMVVIALALFLCESCRLGASSEPEGGTEQPTLTPLSPSAESTFVVGFVGPTPTPPPVEPCLSVFVIRVFHDVDEDGVLDADEVLLPDAEVTVLDAAGVVVRRTFVTKGEVRVDLTDLAPANYSVVVMHPPPYSKYTTPHEFDVDLRDCAEELVGVLVASLTPVPTLVDPTHTSTSDLPVNTPEASSTPTTRPTLTVTLPLSPLPSPIPSLQPPTPTVIVPSQTPTFSPQPTLPPTELPTDTPSPSPEPSETPTPTFTFSPTPSSTPTWTSTPTNTPRPTDTWTATPEPTETPSGGKVTLCHYPGPNQETITVSPNAVQTHLDHGDYLGGCDPWEESSLSALGQSPSAFVGMIVWGALSSLGLRVWGSRRWRNRS